MPTAGATDQASAGAGGGAPAVAAEAPGVGPRLQNETGEYNCFLNAIAQCLWHCASFRESLLAWLQASQQARRPCRMVIVMEKSSANASSS